MKPISEYMTKRPVSIQDDDSVMDAVDVMRKKGIGAVLVKDVQQKPVGIFTERDLMMRMDRTSFSKIDSFAVKDVMSKNLITVDDMQPYTNVIKQMKQYKIRHMPVTHENEIVGMVSLRDLMAHYEEDLEALLQEKEAQLAENIELIKKSEERFRTIFNNSADGIIFADNNERIVAWNPLVAQLSGMNEEELRNKPAHEFFAPEEWLKLGPEIMRSRGGQYHFETKAVAKNKEVVDIDLSISVLKDTKNNTTGFVAIIRDIRERKRMEANLRESRKEIEDIKSGLDQHAIVAILDKDAKISYVNDKYCEISGYSREELIGQGQPFLSATYHSPETLKQLWKNIMAGKIWQGELKRKKKGGSFYWVNTTFVPFRGEDGRPYQYVSIQTDITERKKYEEDLEKANRVLATNAKTLQDMVIDLEKMNRKLKETQLQVIQMEKMATMGTLAAGFAHEIKNPLGIILQGTERLQTFCRDPGREKDRKYVQIIQDAADRADKVVTGILKYSRFSNPEMQPMDLFEVIDSAINLIVDNAKSDNVKISKKYPKIKGDLRGDPTMLQQSFVDLMSNAIDAMPQGGDIKIEVLHRPANPRKKTKAEFVINVQDTGTGIKAKHLSKIFDPFFTTKEVGQGTGLGLSMVYLIVEKHQGTITVQSKPDKGTTFTMTLPVIDAEEIS